MALLEDARAEQDSVDFPRIHGRYRGHAVRITPHLDIIALRKLPSLWLMVYMEASLPDAGTLCVMMRPRNVEYWSSFERLSHELQRPSAWPEHAHIRADGPRGAALAPLIEPHLGFLADPKAKEILITRNGVRLTWLAAEGDRGTYVVTRQPGFSDFRLEPEAVKALLDRCLELVSAAKAGRGGNPA